MTMRVSTKTICFVATSHKFSPIAVLYDIRQKEKPPSPLQVSARRGRAKGRVEM